MTETKTTGSQGSALVVLVAGLLMLVASFLPWGSCPTTPCGGFLQAISQYSGLDLGFGVVTAVAGVMLAVIGLEAFRHRGVTRFATAAVLLALVIVLTAGASVIWMYVIPGDDKDYRWPPFTAVIVGIVGLVAFGASLRLRPTRAPRG